MQKQGFTLMEVIVASLILAVALAGLLTSFLTGEGAVGRAGRKMQAMDFCRQALEELKNAVSAATWPNTGDLAGGGPISRALPPSKLRDNFSGTREYTVTNIDADGDTVYEDDEYKRVTVTVNWTEP